MNTFFFFDDTFHVFGVWVDLTLVFDGQVLGAVVFVRHFEVNNVPGVVLFDREFVFTRFCRQWDANDGVVAVLSMGQHDLFFLVINTAIVAAAGRYRNDGDASRDTVVLGQLQTPAGAGSQKRQQA